MRWSSTTFTLLFLIHGLLNWVLMFQIPIPMHTWFGTLTKIVYDREIAVSERRVKPASILQNTSLILGKQIINILPEGHAVLNPDNEAFCIDNVHTTVTLAIQTNQTTPKLIDIVRTDTTTREKTILSLSKKDIRRLKKATDYIPKRDHSKDPMTIHLPVKRTGVYHLQRVLDESDLDVRVGPSQAVVVRCPKASIPYVYGHKCRGQLSDFRFLVDGVPPIKFRYSKVVGNEHRGHAVLHVHPDSPTTPIDPDSGAVGVEQGGSDEPSAEQQSIPIPINESLSVSGRWEYMIDDIYDAHGNGVNYTEDRLQDSTWVRTYKRNLYQNFFVHERPELALQGCDANNPLRVERGKSRDLPLHFKAARITDSEESPFTVHYSFRSLDNAVPSLADSAVMRQMVLKGNQNSIDIKEPGLYTLVSVTSKHCEGEILEPSSCTLVNPPEPDLSIAAEPIPDKCAGNSIGLVVNLDTVGTPPFTFHYTIRKHNGAARSASETTNKMHARIELKPSDTGHYIYEFTHISDSVYRSPRSLSHKSLILEQDVKAPPSARFIHDSSSVQRREACLDEAATVSVELLGAPPFSLEYELVHHEQRVSYRKTDIQRNLYLLETEALPMGGEYVLILTGVADQSGCRMALQAETSILVSPQKPRAAFGTIHGARKVSLLEGRTIGVPLRFQGRAPWTLYYRRLDDHSGNTISGSFQSSNSELNVKDEGTYQLTYIRDEGCVGIVDQENSLFEVKWIARPEVTVLESSSIKRQEGAFIRASICQGDEDSTDIAFSGTPPFSYEYQWHLRTTQSSSSSSVARRNFASGSRQTSIEMETSKAGAYQYTIFRIDDSRYEFDQRKFSPVHIRQQVHPRPSASFVENGKTYKFCEDQGSANEEILIELSGQPPFRLELEVKIQGVTEPEKVPLTHLESHIHSVRLPTRFQKLGSHAIIIRKAQDANGCMRNMERDAPQVYVGIAELPSISAVEDRQDFCVGEHISFTLSGTPPFTVFYSFEDRERKATVADTGFRRIAERSGDFIITSVSDQRSTEACKARTKLFRYIHDMPRVRVSKGRTATIDIHQGGEIDILFEFGGTPPFFFT